MTTGRAYRRFLPHYENRDQTYFITFSSRNRRVLIPDARSVVLKEIVDRHRVFYYLQTAVVMPDHVHLLLRPCDTSLADIMKRVKGASAREVNRLLQDDGPFWQREYFDRQIRSDEKIRAKGEYIAQNPVRAGIAASPDDYPWLWRVWIEGGDDWI